MDSSLKEEWVSALRSGEYKQARGKLCEVSNGGDESFCCLGVLCDIGLDGVWHLDNNERTYIFEYSGKFNSGYITGWYTELGLSQSRASKLMQMNDGGSSFDTIANYIEKNIETTEKDEKMTDTDRKWAVENRETGRIAYTRESGYNSKAFFSTREQARQALREGRVYSDPTRGRVARVAKS